MSKVSSITLPLPQYVVARVQVLEAIEQTAKVSLYQSPGPGLLRPYSTGNRLQHDDSKAYSCIHIPIPILFLNLKAFAAQNRPQREDRTRRTHILAGSKPVFHKPIFSHSSACCCCGFAGLVFVDRVAKRYRGSDCDSEDFAEAREAGVVAFGVFGRGGFVVWGGAAAGCLREGASRDCFCRCASC